LVFRPSFGLKLGLKLEFYTNYEVTLKLIVSSKIELNFGFE